MQRSLSTERLSGLARELTGWLSYSWFIQLQLYDHSWPARSDAGGGVSPEIGAAAGERAEGRGGPATPPDCSDFPGYSATAKIVIW